MEWLLSVTAFAMGCLLVSVIVYLIQRSNRMVLAERVRKSEQEVDNLEGEQLKLQGRYQGAHDKISELKSEIVKLETELTAERKKNPKKSGYFPTSKVDFPMCLKPCPEMPSKKIAGPSCNWLKSS